MIDRLQVLRFRAHAQQLDRERGTLEDTAILDYGVQDTGPDGGRWALAVRGVDTAALDEDDLLLLWTVRGAPHYYRRSDAAQIAAAVAPYSEVDAGKRIFDAAKPLKAAGIPNLTALDEVAANMREVVTEPLPKGEVSAELAKRMPEPYLRYCRQCKATHLYEMPFRLGAVRAGIELDSDTSPPAMRRIPRFRKAAKAEERFDLVRAYLRLFGPATHKQAAEFVDTTVKEIKAHWPEDVVEVEVEGERRWMLEADEEALRSAEAHTTRLVGPYDLYLQGRDRQTLVPDVSRHKELWPVLGRPGAVVIDGEVAATWRPRKSGKKFKLAVTPWRALTATDRKAIAAEAERLAAYRGTPLTALDIDE